MFNHKATIICASKYYDVHEMKVIYQKGYHHFGENRVQDLLKKQSELESFNITWHFIGHLQTNKVKDMINRIDYLHTLDRLKLANTIEQYAKHEIKCFIQVNISEESQKSGILLKDLPHFLNEIKIYDKIKIVGLMSIGVENDLELTEQVFKKARELVNELNLSELSIGMSDDYKIALKYKPTYLRLGRYFKTMLKGE
jgi:PLP dependent protein